MYTVSIPHHLQSSLDAANQDTEVVQITVRLSCKGPATCAFDRDDLLRYSARELKAMLQGEKPLPQR